MSLTEYFTPLSEIEFPKFSDLTNRFQRQVDVDNTGALPAREPFVPPKHWTTELMPFRGSYAPCYVSRAEDEHSFVGLVPGMSSYPFDWQQEVSHLNSQGISVISLGLLQTQSYASYYPVNKELVRTFFLGEKRSPLYRFGDPDLQRHAIVHSTACPILIDNLSEHGALERKPNSLSGVTYLNPFMDTYSSSKHYHPYKSLVYSAFMLANPDKGIGTTPLEKWWMGEKDTDHLPSIYDRPENARVKKTRTQIRELNRQIWNGERAETSTLPQKMYLGREDFCICADTARSIAHTMGMDIEEFEGDHFDMLKLPTIQENVVSRLIAIRDQSQTLSPFEAALQEDKPKRFEATLDDFIIPSEIPSLRGL